MNRKPGLLISIATFVFSLALTGWAWPQLPGDQSIPIHWDASGRPNGYAAKPVVLLGMPLLVLALAALFLMISLVEPRRRHLYGSARAYTAVWGGLLLAVAAAQTATVLFALGHTRSATTLALGGVGVVFVVIGNYLPKLRSNFFVGIRTPWTLSSDHAWSRTHRLGGRLFILVGVLIILAALTGNGPLSVAVILGGTVLVVGVSLVYSYVVWRADAAKLTVGR